MYFYYTMIQKNTVNNVLYFLHTKKENEVIILFFSLDIHK